MHSWALRAIGAMTLGRLPPPEYCTDSRLGNLPPSFCEGGLLLVLELWPEEQALCGKFAGRVLGMDTYLGDVGL